MMKATIRPTRRCQPNPTSTLPLKIKSRLRSLKNESVLRGWAWSLIDFYR
jgi:hypothetical protein